MFKQVKDKRGTLSAIEFKKLPFKAKRVFLLYDLVNKQSRGGHYHKKCKEFLFIISGKCNILLEDKKQGTIDLHCLKVGESILVPTYTKVTITKPSKNCVICVLCNTKYDPKDAYYD